MKWYQMLSIGGFVLGWFGRAAKDKVIDKKEQSELLTQLIKMASVDISLEK